MKHRTEQLLTLTLDLANLLLLQAGREDTDAAAEEVVEGFEVLGLTGAERDQAMDLVRLFVYRGITVIQLHSVLLAAVRKVYANRGVLV